MRIPRAEFEEYVPDYVGKIRATHDGDNCQNGSTPNNMIVERTDDGWARAFCFRCGGRGSFELVRHYHPGQSTDRTAGEGSADHTGGGIHKPVGIERVEQSRTLADSYDFPKEGREWLAKSGFTIQDADRRGCRWSGREGALFLPVVQQGVSAFGDVLPGYVRRKWSPKSYNVMRLTEDPLWGLYRASETAKPLPYQLEARRPVVIVEDVLSAWRVSEVMDCIALCGTELHSPVISAVAREGYTDAIVWLDADNPVVRMKARKIANRLNGLMVTHMIETGKDPKHENVGQVRERLLAVLDTP